MVHGVGMWDGGWLMLLWMFLFWGGLAALVIWSIRTLFATAQSGSPPPTRSPLDIAKERYARGEISREALVEITQNLKEIS